jgi:thiosulfate/3-mercaptopyruvate sulfurtransferase
LEVWEKVFLKDADFVESTHGQLGCSLCHGGDDQQHDKSLAHVNLIIDPSGEGKCTACHQDTAHVNELSLHTTLAGFTSVLEARGGNLEEGSALDTVMENHCEQCHTSCGQCHVSRPDELGGGLVSGHKFRETPSTQYNCVACHGSRVGAEYLGENEGVPADVHWTSATMTCTACHGDELHGADETAATRYENPDLVRCEDCHADVLSNTEGNAQHEQHLDDLACQVCHSTTYKNCYGCHVSIDEDGLPCRTSEPSVMQFEIGLNPIQSSERPYKYVVLRHVPTCAGTCDYYGDDLLPDFDALPTWKYATPHNIQLQTPQNESCDSCHGNPDIFLTEEDILPEETEANKVVIVSQIPGS